MKPTLMDGAPCKKRMARKRKVKCWRVAVGTSVRYGAQWPTDTLAGRDCTVQSVCARSGGSGYVYPNGASAHYTQRQNVKRKERVCVCVSVVCVPLSLLYIVQLPTGSPCLRPKREFPFLLFYYAILSFPIHRTRFHALFQCPFFFFSFFFAPSPNGYSRPHYFFFVRVFPALFFWQSTIGYIVKFQIDLTHSVSIVCCVFSLSVCVCVCFIARRDGWGKVKSQHAHSRMTCTRSWTGGMTCLGDVCGFFSSDTHTDTTIASNRGRFSPLDCLAHDSRGLFFNNNTEKKDTNRFHERTRDKDKVDGLSLVSSFLYFFVFIFCFS